MNPLRLLILAFVAILLSCDTITTHQTAFPKQTELIDAAYSGGKLEEPTNEAPRCNEKTEFHCKLENRCIPAEWRCDFTEQCLDGQDELGCAPEWCGLDHGLCYWLNDWPNGNLTATTNFNVWRRYHFVQDYKLECRQEKSTNKNPLAQLLNDLRLQLNKYAKLIFVPLFLDTKRVKRELARITAPAIGQTNSMCQLRFKYTLRANQMRANSSNARSFDFKTSLRLKVSDKKNSNRNAKILWSRSIEDESYSEPDGAGSHWMIGVAELGHLRYAKLSFEAESQAIERRQQQQSPQPLRYPTIGGQRLPRTSNGLDAGDSAHDHLYAIVALSWWKFHDCNWPQGARGRTNGGGGGQADGAPPVDNNLSDFDDWPVPMDSQDENGASGKNGCPVNDFQCSNGICLPQERLCNFVDDCMSSYGERVSNLTPAHDNNAEDETRDLCNPILGMEHFDNDFNLKTGPNGPLEVNKFWSWDYGNWPKDKMKIRNNEKQLVYLPIQDHTRKTSKGRFLSVEIPIEFGKNSSNENNTINSIDNGDTHRKILWTSIDSPWLEKLPPENADCRVKFFFNLVSSTSSFNNWPFKVSLIVEHLTIDKIDNANQTFKLVKKIDSFLHSHTINVKQLVSDGQQGRSIEYPGVDFWREANVKLVGLNEGDIFTARLIIRAEFDKFDHSKEQKQDQLRVTINIDDMSTHFGCGSLDQHKLARVKMSQMLLSNKDIQIFDPLHNSRNKQPPPNQNYPQTPAPLFGVQQHKRHSNQQFNPDNPATNSAQIDPQKLIISVFGAVCVIIGLIAIIVFVLVPYVERVMMNYQEHIQLGMTAEVSDLPIDPDRPPPPIDDLTSFSDEMRADLVSREQQLRQQMLKSFKSQRLATSNSSQQQTILDSELHHHTLEFIHSRMTSNSNSSLASINYNNSNRANIHSVATDTKTTSEL